MAFANHSGFLQAVEEAEMEVAGVMGTSAGAITGSLYCAGYSPEECAEELSRVAPINLLKPAFPDMGILSLHGVVERLREVLPPRFEDLKYEFAVGVVDKDGRHVLVDHGPLAEAVAASAAIPGIFAPLHIPGQKNGPFRDGGVVDRVGVKAWRNRRRRQLSQSSHHLADGLPPLLVHVISRSSPFSGYDDVLATGEPDLYLVNSPRSGVNFFDLGDFHGQLEAAYQRSQPVIRQATVALSRT